MSFSSCVPPNCDWTGRCHGPFLTLTINLTLTLILNLTLSLNLQT